MPRCLKDLTKLTRCLGKLVTRGYLNERLLKRLQTQQGEITFFTACLAFGIQKPDKRTLFSVALIPKC